MTPISRLRLLGLGVGAAVLTGAASLALVSSGGSPLLIAPLLAPLFAVFGLVLGWAGLHVRRFKDRKRTWVTPLAAMRIAIAARASGYVASAAAGVLAGVLVASLGRIEAPLMASNALAAGFACAGALWWCVVAVVVERWCIADIDDDSKDPGEVARPSASPA
ncbi:DUF3180 domain-containing protein [Schaalia hyovaginalis]|uniref:Uncharacterized membrane protein YhaH (DUF805 family) n=1 Tax=Schaalia hyovaginalis TaxID=29316 RepID=A0A923IY54_9ACTO|nr:DUF3180 domain-containing protein [Schaalia hyovaginalis]MBB6334011.1 uncharacterized membrane protein YhaH (DUF805 family) [Schaalia hyovaginalis]MDY2669603.1 DUF3180 domain-containing protein [Schaalia hyovaginalis]